MANPAHHRDKAVFLTQTGYDIADENVVEDGKTTFRQRIFGEICDCRAFIFAGHRIVAVLPMGEYYTTRTVYVAVMAFVLAVVIGVFVMLLWRIDSASDQLAAFYNAQEEKRAAELELGRTIQMSALPLGDSLKSDYCHSAAFMQPAREVGGD